MLISQIVAMSTNRVIGNQGKIPWDIPGEQKMFKKITMGHSVIMGRKTFESIGKPLPGRTNIVITRQENYSAPGCTVVPDLKAAIAACPDGETEAFICGGEQIYKQFMPVAGRLYLTLIHREFDGDAFFPAFSEDDFRKVKSKAVLGVEPYTFAVYDRVK